MAINMETVVALAPGLGVTFLVLGVYKAVLEKKVQAQEHIQDLLGAKPGARSPGGAMATPADAQEILKKRRKGKDGQLSYNDQLEIKLERANIPLKPEEFLMICGGVAFVGMLFGMFIFGLHFIIALLLGGGMFFAPFLYLKLKTMMRMKKASAQFADVLDSMVNGFKTGYGFSRSIQMVAANYDDPWATEFGKMSAEMNLGATQEDALLNLSNRVPLADVDLFVTALLIQKDTGGNMTELLGNLSKTCRDRYKMYQKVGAISAQGKLSAGIICCIPPLLCSIMFLFLPDAMTAFVTNPIGMILIGMAVFWMICGIGVLFKIVDIEV